MKMCLTGTNHFLAGWPFPLIDYQDEYLREELVLAWLACTYSSLVRVCDVRCLPSGRQATPKALSQSERQGTPGYRRLNDFVNLTKDNTKDN